MPIAAAEVITVGTRDPGTAPPRRLVWAGVVTALGCLSYLTVRGSFRALTAAGVLGALAALALSPRRR